MKATAIPEGQRGLWNVVKQHFKMPYMHTYRKRWVPMGDYTSLCRVTDATLHTPMGEVVMEDTPPELKSHLQFILSAHGDVLVTGLGLGCVARGLQANPNVRSITLVEISKDVIDLVWPHMPHDRIELIHADALAWVPSSKRRWDCAWHDLCGVSEHSEGLALLHAELMIGAERSVGFQGAWAFPRYIRRLFQNANLGAMK